MKVRYDPIIIRLHPTCDSTTFGTHKMAIKRQGFRPNKSTGIYERLIGWKWDEADQKYIQHKFYLGKDLAKAELANRRLEGLWEHIAASHRAGPPPGDRPVWNAVTIEIGKAIAKGQTHINVERRQITTNSDGKPVFENAESYARHIHSSAAAFPMISFVPDDGPLYQEGLVFEQLCVQNQIDKVKELALAGHRLPTGSPIMLDATGETLHEALDGFINHIRRTYVTAAVEGEHQTTTPHGSNLIKSVGRLKEKHDDMSLAAISFDTIQGMIDVWCRRPLVKRRKKPISAKTASEHIKLLKCFFKWLNRSDKFAWRKPPDFDELVTKVSLNQQEIAARMTPFRRQVATFQLTDLALLYKYATPFERLLFLLGMNCGFGAAEIASLLRNQVQLFTMHPYSRDLGFHSTDQDSFISRMRTKTSVYGEWILWTETVAALQWADRRRLRQTKITAGPLKGLDITAKSDSVLVLSEDGTRLVKQTKACNRSSRIANLWENGLCQRIRADNKTFRKLSFGKLRKTATNLVRQIGGGEAASLFVCHGTPISSDELLEAYANRPFAKLFASIKAMRTQLQAVFEFQVEWPEARKKGGANLSVGEIERIDDLLADNIPVSKIAKEIGVAPTTIYRRIKAKDFAMPTRASLANHGIE